MHKIYGCAITPGCAEGSTSSQLGSSPMYDHLGSLHSLFWVEKLSLMTHYEISSNFVSLSLSLLWKMFLKFKVVFGLRPCPELPDKKMSCTNKGLPDTTN